MKPEAAAETAAGKTAVAKDVGAYLARIHGTLGKAWAEIQELASRQFPGDHPVNQPDRRVVIALLVDIDGKPAGVRVHRSSGVPPLDNSALRLMTWIHKLPPKPASLGLSRATLLWSFFRGQRGCDPRFVAVERDDLTPRETMALALTRKDWAMARQVLKKNPGDVALLNILAGAGLASSSVDHNRLALQVTPSVRLVSILRHDADAKIWAYSVEILERRKAADGLERLLSATLASRELLLPGLQTTLISRKQKLVLLVGALSRLDARIDGALATQLLKTRILPGLVIDVLPLIRDPAALESAEKKWSGSPGVAGALAVRRTSLAPSRAAAAHIRAGLGAPKHGARLLTLAALERYPVPGLGDHLFRLASKAENRRDIRIRATLALAKLPDGVRPLYKLLLDRDPEIQITAARALSGCKRLGRSIYYRLADLAGRSRGKVRAAAVANQARLGLKQFTRDLLFRCRKISTPLRAVVAAELWHMGAGVVPELEKMASSSNRALRHAARGSLKKITAPAAASALARLKAPDSKKVSSAAPGAPHPLTALLKLAVVRQ